MKKIIFHHLLLLLIFSHIGGVLAQETFVPPSPTAISMIKGSQTDVNLYTGKANINIPIYTVKEGSLSVDISMKYVGGSGIKVQEIAGEAGLGWSLMAGGLITKTNRGISSNREGALKNNPSYSDLQNALAYYIDLEPDVFNSTLGGRIIFDENKKPHFMNEQGFKIIQDGISSADRLWIIADTRGNTYYFGETDASRERVVQTSGGVQSLSNNVSSWYMNKIVSAQGESIQFEYEKSGKLNQFTYYSFSRILNTGVSGEWRNNISTLPNPTEEIHLSKIKTSSAILQFLYTDRQDFANSKAISEIKVLDTKDKLITKYAFETDYFKSAGAAATLRLKMKAIKQYNSGSDEANLIAAFDYNESENLPAGNSEKFDYWGYYNNNTTGKYFLTEGANKEANLNRCKANILTGILWPTGGSTRYSYGLNSYRRNGIDYSGGGLRVDTISELNNGSTSKLTKYVYTSTTSGQELSTGLLHNWFDIKKGYVAEWTRIVRFVEHSDEVHKWENALPLSQAIDFDGILVGYSQVTIIHPDQSSEEYSFQDYALFPDEIRHYSYVELPFARPSRVEDLVQMNNTDQYIGLKSVTSNAIQRGLLRNKTIRNEKHKPVKSIDYKYNVYIGTEIPAFESRKIYSYIPPAGAWENELKHYYIGSLYYERVMAARLTEIKENNYFPGTNLPVRSTTITNEYKQAPRAFVLAARTQKESDGSISSVGYNYPADMVSLGRDQTGVYSEMTAKNMISPVIEQTETNDGQKISFSRTNYGRFNSNNLLLPKSVEVQNGNASVETRMLFNDYDLKGNLLEQLQTDGVRNSYVWGYNGQYPIAKITNAVNKKASTLETTGSSILNINAQNSSKTVTFTTTRAGNLIMYPNYGGDPGQSYTMRYNLSGVTSGNICVYRGQALPSGSCSSTTPDVSIYIAAGTYTMTISDMYSTNPAPIGSLYFTYPSAETTYSTADFFYEGFEENTASNVISEKAHTGEKCWKGSYTTNVNLNTGRNYIIQWWNFDNNSWKFNEQPFTANLTLAGVIDDVRIFPKDAQMTTYTYQPLIGITSSVDVRGLATYYDYDGFQRLKNIRDQNKNIIKNVRYNYDQSVTPAYTTHGNDLQSKYFQKVCPSGQTGSWVIYTVPAGKYNFVNKDESNAKALADINLNGQNYANQNGACNPTPCSGDDKKLINGDCETGRKVYTASVQVGNSHTCTYHFEWSDGSQGPDYLETNSYPCAIQ